MTEPKRPPPDWEKIEAQYSMGIMTLKEIADPQGITEGAIRKRAKTRGWSRDTRAKVNAKAQDYVDRDAAAQAREREGRQRPAALADIREHEIIEAVARNVAVVRIKHREEIDRLRQIAHNMVIELQLAGSERKDLSELARRLAEDKALTGDQVRAIEKALSLTNRSTLLARLAEAMRTIVSMEREAYGMADIPLGKDGEESQDEADKPVKVVINVVDASKSYEQEGEGDDEE